MAEVVELIYQVCHLQAVTCGLAIFTGMHEHSLHDLGKDCDEQDGDSPQEKLLCSTEQVSFEDVGDVDIVNLKKHLTEDVDSVVVRGGGDVHKVERRGRNGPQNVTTIFVKVAHFCHDGNGNSVLFLSWGEVAVGGVDEG